MFVQGVNVDLHPVGIEDAGWIAELRSDERVFRFLSQSRPISAEEQREWMKSKVAKEGFYWKIWHRLEDRFVGLISLYSIQSSCAELGRFISLNPYAAIGAEYAVLNFAFSQLGIERVRCHTASENRAVVSLHARLGFRTLSEAFEPELGMKMVWQELNCEKYLIADYSRLESILSKK